jgi:hypothetical protein
MMGVVQDGGDFVAAADILTAGVLVAYATSIFLRYRAAKVRTEKEP